MFTTRDDAMTKNASRGEMVRLRRATPPHHGMPPAPAPAPAPAADGIAALGVAHGGFAAG